MLVLSRKRGESVVIGEGKNKTVLTVVDVKGDAVRIGVEADPSIPVHRQEIYNQIQRVKKKNEAKNMS